jgi:pimeloyl-ACP methyl ester carboxylesterase
MATAVEERVELPCGGVALRRGGDGPPLVVLHRDTGTAGWTRFHEELARDFTVCVPELPGYDRSDRPAWLRSVPQLAILTAQLLDVVAPGPVPVVGLGFGGWIAAEVLTLHPGRFAAAVLQGAPGVKPADGEIFDQFLVSSDDYVRRGFADRSAFAALYGEEPVEDQVFVWESNREMTTRIAWKPYMFDPALPHLLRGVGTRVLLVRGADDGIVPASCGEVYAESLANASVAELPGGHQLDLERPAELAETVREFVA